MSISFIVDPSTRSLRALAQDEYNASPVGDALYSILPFLGLELGDDHGLVLQFYTFAG